MSMSKKHPLKTRMYVLIPANFVPCNEAWIKKKKARHGSFGRRCSCEAPTGTQLTVIWHTVKDHQNLRSNCVPVGRAEPCLSLTVLPLAPIPTLASVLLREPEGGPVSEFAMAGCHLAPSSTYSSIHIHWHVYTHTQWREELSPPLWFRAFTEGI